MRKSVKIMLIILAVLFVIVTVGSLLVRAWLGKTNYKKDEDVVINQDAFKGTSEGVTEAETQTDLAGETERVMPDEEQGSPDEQSTEKVSAQKTALTEEMSEKAISAEMITEAVSEEVTEETAKAQTAAEQKKAGEGVQNEEESEILTENRAEEQTGEKIEEKKEAVSERQKESGTEKETETGIETETETEAEIGTETEAETEAETETVTEAETETETETESETESETETDAETESLTENFGSEETENSSESKKKTKRRRKRNKSQELHAADVYDLSEVVPITDEEAKNTYSLLVIGGASPDEVDDPDKREDASAVIMMTINHNNKESVFYSFDTDLYVEIPDLGGGKLGNAYAVGGGPLLLSTMEKNYGLHIDNYASISFKDVARILEMPAFETMDVSKEGLSVVKELVYSLGAHKPTEVTSYISELLPYVTHNLDGQSLLRIILQIPRIVPYYGVEGMIPGEIPVQELDGCLVPDAKELADYLREKLYGLSGEETLSEAISENNGQRMSD